VRPKEIISKIAETKAQKELSTLISSLEMQLTNPG
jgi:hypothetical protein